jgi:hypothetical protein
MTSYDDIDDDWEDDYDDDIDTEDDSEPTVPCPHCRREIHEDSPRCPYCEEYISTLDSTGVKPWWIYLGVGVCLFIVCLWMFPGLFMGLWLRFL